MSNLGPDDEVALASWRIHYRELMYNQRRKISALNLSPQKFSTACSSMQPITLVTHPLTHSPSPEIFLIFFSPFFHSLTHHRLNSKKRWIHFFRCWLSSSIQANERNNMLSGYNDWTAGYSMFMFFSNILIYKAVTIPFFMFPDINRQLLTFLKS